MTTKISWENIQFSKCFY